VKGGRVGVYTRDRGDRGGGSILDMELPKLLRGGGVDGMAATAVGGGAMGDEERAPAAFGCADADDG